MIFALMDGVEALTLENLDVVSIYLDQLISFTIRMVDFPLKKKLFPLQMATSQSFSKNWKKFHPNVFMNYIGEAIHAVWFPFNFCML